ncbi:BRCT domain-containing protein [Artemisia annua]|uniref:DNA repair protein REV1 n=1 Tax=Artemisia annua TaxID=35608 RepID=A0A2U1Q2S7_ARTAN|nr:BRCT domain-containing protein [Artemisia annua]
MSRSSLNSGSNSKRTNSNVTRSNNSNKKRKKDGQQQQTLVGMAWGSNSKSSSRSSAFRTSPFTDFGSYMEVKNRKLHEQFDAEASCSSHGGSGSEKPVFYGVSIFVDGYTVPSSQELRGYMLKHGGRFENYFSRQRVTHIICSNLPNSKVKNLRSFSRGLPVVKPTWVLDSVAAKKLLNWVPYQLDQIASEANNQPKLSTFLGLRSSLIPGDHAEVAIASDVNISEVSDSAEHVKQPNQDSEYYVCDSLDESEVEEPTCSNNCEKESEYYVRDSLDESEVEEPTCSNNCEKEAPRTNDVLIKEMQSECSPCQPSASEGSRCSDIQHATETLSVVPNSSNKGHSTSSDPNFVETYFKNSRLHFIGTWKQRYRKRFPRSSDALRPSSSISPSSTCQRDTIIHIDMDCFFVSVVIRNRPELWDKPVAVCHSDNPRGTSEISSANYPARDHGVRAGIFVRDAKALCPHLVIVPYNFEAYEEVADQFYSILHKHCNKVQAMSCDEAILDITDLEVDDPEHLASLIRKEIFDTTGCTASVGISSNMLMARLATRSAKPDGQCYLPLDKVDDFMEELPVKALPGIGRALEEKLKGRHVKTCGELRMISKESLQKDFGQKTGDMLWNHCRGIDNRLVGMIQETKSVGADVNWGVRFKDMKDCQHFLLSLCKEVSLRLHGCGVSGRTFTLKVKKRKTDEEPVKYMGCGDCDNLSHSLTVPMATDDVDVLQRITKQLFSHFHIDVKDVRGVGLHVTKLECVDNLKQGSERSSIRSWLVSASVPKDTEYKDTKEQFSDQLDQSKSNSTLGAIMSNREANHSSGVPSSPSEFDADCLKSLPPEIFSEYNEFYGGKLISFVSKHRSESIDVGTSSILPGDAQGVRAKLESEISNNVAAASTSQIVGDVGVMPSSLSQIDASALQEYPQEIRDEILNNLPAHRNPETISDASPLGLNLNHLEIQAKPTDHDSSNALWSGNPPHWVQMYKSSDSQILRYLSDTYSGLKSTYDLSSVLLKSVAATEVVCIGGRTTECDDAIRCLCELLKQYIELKVESDLEEIHTCFRILRRLSVKSELFLQVYNTTIPHLQMTVSEKYGGSLYI